MRRLRAVLTFAACAVAVVATPSRTRADAFPAPSPGWYALLGGNVGMALLAKRANGAVLGAEASFVHLGEGMTWAGVYGDALYDTSWGTGRFSIGPEIGAAIFGVDGGFLMQLDHGRTETGFAVRPLITFGVAGLYGRWGHLFTGDASEDIAEIGLLVKYPLLVPDDTNPHHGPPR
jgi:hypothetical protein